MGKVMLSLYIFPFFMLLPLSSCIADPLGNSCGKDSIFTNSSQISANIANLLPTLVNEISATRFASASSGDGPVEVYGLAQCRGDVNYTDCSNCMSDAAKRIRELCPNETDARIWYDYCFLRYDNKSFIGKVDTSVQIYYYNVENVTNPRKFNKTLGDLMSQIINQAALPVNGGLGKGEKRLSDFSTLYALGQCTGDLSQLDCAQCLAIAVGNFQNICNNKKGCRVLYSSCYVRYELYPFFFPLDSNQTLAGVRKVIRHL